MLNPQRSYKARPPHTAKMGGGVPVVLDSEGLRTLLVPWCPLCDGYCRWTVQLPSLSGSRPRAQTPQTCRGGSGGWLIHPPHPASLPQGSEEGSLEEPHVRGEGLQPRVDCDHRSPFQADSRADGERGGVAHLLSGEPRVCSTLPEVALFLGGSGQRLSGPQVLGPGCVCPAWMCPMDTVPSGAPSAWAGT